MKMRKLYSSDEIEARCAELGAQISEDYAGKELTAICVLVGAMPFFSDLARHLTIPVRFDVLRASSYHGGTSSSGEVDLLNILKEPLEGKHVLLVEDIVDSGRTMNRIIASIQEMNPASVKLVTLLDKPSRRVVDMEADYVGYTIEDRFIIGYGLDFEERYRNLPYLAEVIG